MILDGFSTVDFGSADGTGFVYILCWLAADEMVPFYVGQTKSIWGRLNDYHWADFQAATDFRVGEAVKYLNERGLRVVANYRKSIDRHAEETEIIQRLHEEGRRLLNDCRGYDYRTASSLAERIKVRDFVDSLLALKVAAKA